MLTEARGSLRVKENLNCSWAVKDSDFYGQGKVLNISTSGLLLEARNFFAPQHGANFRLDSFLPGTDNFLPNEGRLVWSRNQKKDRTLCGIEFIAPEETVLSKLRERVQKRIMEATNNRKVTSLVGVSLFVVMIAMTAFIVTQQNSIYNNMAASSHMLMGTTEKQAALTRNYSTLYSQTREMLDLVTKELAQTKDILLQTEALLVESRQANLELQNEIAVFEAQGLEVTDNSAEFAKNRGQMEKQITQLNEQNNRFSAELADLKQQMRAFEGEVENIDEGRAMITLFKNKLRLVKTKMHYLKREAHDARVAARKEKDRILALQGNGGFLIKNGQIYKGQAEHATGNKDVEIDVSFVE